MNVSTRNIDVSELLYRETIRKTRQRSCYTKYCLIYNIISLKILHEVLFSFLFCFELRLTMLYTRNDPLVFIRADFCSYDSLIL